jgi:hypothetical protein
VFSRSSEAGRLEVESARSSGDIISDQSVVGDHDCSAAPEADFVSTTSGIVSETHLSVIEGSNSDYVTESQELTDIRNNGQSQIAVERPDDPPMTFPATEQELMRRIGRYAFLPDISIFSLRFCLGNHKFDKVVSRGYTRLLLSRLIPPAFCKS